MTPQQNTDSNSTYSLNQISPFLRRPSRNSFSKEFTLFIFGFAVLAIYFFQFEANAGTPTILLSIFYSALGIWGLLNLISDIINKHFALGLVILGTICTGGMILLGYYEQFPPLNYALSCLTIVVLSLLLPHENSRFYLPFSILLLCLGLAFSEPSFANKSQLILFSALIGILAYKGIGRLYNVMKDYERLSTESQHFKTHDITPLIWFDEDSKRFVESNHAASRLLTGQTKQSLVEILNGDKHPIAKLFKTQYPSIISEINVNDQWKYVQNFTFGNVTQLVGLTVSRIQLNDKSRLLVQVNNQSNQYAAKQALSLLQSALSQISSPVLILSKDHKVIFSNRAVDRFFNRSNSKSHLQSVEELQLFKASNLLYNENFWQTLLQTAYQKEITSYVDSNGHQKKLEVTYNLVSTDKGFYNCIVIQDVTQREQTLRVIKTSEHQFRTIFQNAPMGIIIIDMNKEILDANEQLAALLGYDSKVSLIGSNIDQFVHPEDMDKSIVTKFQTGQSNDVHHVEKRYRKKNGDYVWCELTSALYYEDPNDTIPTYAVGMVQDISERIASAKAIRSYASKIEQSNKELEQFAYAISHDLQEPLRMVSSYLQIIDRRYSALLPKEAHEYIHFAVDGSKRMGDLIQGVLAYSRINTQGKDFEPTNLNEVLEVIRLDLRPSIATNEASIHAVELPMVQADRIQMIRLFTNLIGNAIRYRSEAPPVIMIDYQKQNDEYLFSIKDNGIGIDPEYSDKIFGLFQRLHQRSDYPGSGIGLSLCQRIVARHGGKIWVESALGEGATFFFTLAAVD